MVLQRDRGICAWCGLDTVSLERRLRRERHRILEYRRRLGFTEYHLPYEEDASGLLHEYAVLIDGRRWLAPQGRTLWEADHITPVIEGGGLCGLDGYRTLCLWCHKRATAELARRRAQKRYGQEALAFA